MKIPFGKPIIGAEEKALVQEVLMVIFWFMVQKLKLLNINLPTLLVPNTVSVFRPAQQECISCILL